MFEGRTRVLAIAARGRRERTKLLLMLRQGAKQICVVGFVVMAFACTKREVTDIQRAELNAQALELKHQLTAHSAADPGSAVGEQSNSDEQSDVVIRLVFADNVDLDLYVTDPLLETVYFARHNSRTGGVITADVRCDTPGERIEEVRFKQRWPGQYRVGVDFPQSCDGQALAAPYAVSATVNGKVYSAHGVVDLQYFEVVVLEFTVSGDAPIVSTLID